MTLYMNMHIDIQITPVFQNSRQFNMHQISGFSLLKNANSYIIDENVSIFEIKSSTGVK